jgi:hypothetical protein
VAVQRALSLDATPPGTYRQRGTNSLQRLFRSHFPELVARYEPEFAKQLGKFRLERISKAAERFLACGDYPFSRSVLHFLVGPPLRLCPSCSQKRTLRLRHPIPHPLGKSEL